MEHVYKKIPGWSDEDVLSVYQTMVDCCPAGGQLVEVGSWMGRSASMALVCIMNSKKKINFLMIDNRCLADNGGDPSKNYDNLPDLCANLSRHGLLQMADVCTMPSVQAAKMFGDLSLAGAFVDGSHDYKSVREDIALWLPKVRPGGILAGHDFAADGLTVVQAVRDSFGLNFIQVGRCWLHVVGGKNEYTGTL